MSPREIDQPKLMANTHNNHDSSWICLVANGSEQPKHVGSTDGGGGSGVATMAMLQQLLRVFRLVVFATSKIIKSHLAIG